MTIHHSGWENAQAESAARAKINPMEKRMSASSRKEAGVQGADAPRRWPPEDSRPPPAHVGHGCAPGGPCAPGGAVHDVVVVRGACDALAAALVDAARHLGAGAAHFQDLVGCRPERADQFGLGWLARVHRKNLQVR